MKKSKMPPQTNSSGNTEPTETNSPQFAEPIATPDPDQFTVQHGSDAASYKILDTIRDPQPRQFPPVVGAAEPVVNLQEALGDKGSSIVAEIQKAGRIVFHSVGDTGNVQGPEAQNAVADKMESDFDETDPRFVPSFFYHLGDVVYSFGEAAYYYDQFYDAYRNYPAPIFAIAGNHDGMVAPNSTAETLAAFLENFCAAGQPPHRTPESGELSRTAQVQPGVYFTLEAPFVRILGLYSNCLEDPGVIAGDSLGTVQLDFLRAAFDRIKAENYAGAVLIAVHHPPYVAATLSRSNFGKHGGSPEMNAQIDAVCAEKGVWPHAVLSGHAHNYQRFSRYKDGRETPYIVAGNGGHAHNALTRKGQPALRVPAPQPSSSVGGDQIVFESYDDQEYGYLRLLVDTEQLRIEYHPASDGEAAKTPDDSVTVSLSTHKMIHFIPSGPSNSSSDGMGEEPVAPAQATGNGPGAGSQS
jgi:hypothetical protein